MRRWTVERLGSQAMKQLNGHDRIPAMNHMSIHVPSRSVSTGQIFFQTDKLSKGVAVQKLGNFMLSFKIDILESFSRQ